MGQGGVRGWERGRPQQAAAVGCVWPSRTTPASLTLCLSFLLQSDRVLKQNRGSAGEGIWVVKPHCWERCAGMEALHRDTVVSATEMRDNTTVVAKLGDFMERCLEYIEGGRPGGGD
jgi:hypothetical protein